MRACLLIYDIPQNSGVPNPSYVLRKVGVRPNLSCWIIPEHLVPWDWIAENLHGNGIKCEVVRFDENEEKKLRVMAADALRREIGRVQAGLADSLERARLAYADVVNSPGLADEQRTKKFDLYAKAVLRRAKKDLVAAESASVAFGLFGDVQGLLEGTRQAIAAETSSLVAMLTRKETFQSAPANKLAGLRVMVDEFVTSDNEKLFGAVFVVAHEAIQAGENVDEVLACCQRVAKQRPNGFSSDSLLPKERAAIRALQPFVMERAEKNGCNFYGAPAQAAAHG